MAETTITNLPNAAALTGTERVPMDQGGTTVDATTAEIAATLPAATTTTAGKLSAADKAKLDSITVDQARIIRWYVRNETGVTIAKGIPVYAINTNGVTPTISPADASTEETAARTIGITQESIAHQDYGWVVEVGPLDGISTSTLTENAIIWLSETTGQMTTTRPTQPAHGVVLGYCVKQAAGTAGIIYVKVDNGLELAELHDVLLTGAATDDVLALAADGLWKKRTLGSAASAAISDFAPAAQGVTNGNSHNHDGGDGAQIAYSSLAGLPTLGGAAALSVGTTAGTVAAGDAPATAITAHAGAADPHTQYLAKVPAPATLTYAATVDLDMTALAGAFRTITLTGNITFTTSNRSAGEMVTLRIICDGTQRTLTFPVGWRFIGPKPANITASKVAVLTVMLFGTADTDGVAAYGVES